MDENLKSRDESFERFRKVMGRKVEEWKNAPILNTTRYMDTVAIYALPTFTPSELCILNTLAIFKKGIKVPQWFVLTKGWGRTATNYLVNTEGYDYCRYIAKLGVLKYKEGTTLTNCVKVFG